MVELREYFRAVLMHGVDQLREAGNLGIVIRSDLARRGFSFRRNVKIAGDDQRCAARGDRNVEIDELVRDETVDGRSGFGRGGLEQPPGDGQLTNLDWGKEHGGV